MSGLLAEGGLEDRRGGSHSGRRSASFALPAAALTLIDPS